MIKILYFGVLKELLGVKEEIVEYSGKENTEKLLCYLRQRGDNWHTSLSKENVFRVVINKQIVYEKTAINDGDEVAILPPVTGG